MQHQREIPNRKKSKINVDLINKKKMIEENVNLEILELHTAKHIFL